MALLTIAGLLGGKRVLGRDIRTQMDLIEVGHKGVPKASLMHLAKYIGSSISKMAALLPVTERTIQRYSAKDRFDESVSEDILQIAQVVARGVEVFEDKGNFLNWLAQPAAAFGGRTPMSLLDSCFGIDMVLDELTRIEHGVVS